MAPSQAFFDLSLPGHQPIHGSVEVIFVSHAKPQHLPQTTPAGFLTKTSGRGKLRAWINDSCHNQCQCQRLLSASFAADDLIDSQSAQETQDCSHMAVGLTSNYIERLFKFTDYYTSLEQLAQSLNNMRGPLGQIGQGALFDLRAFAIGFAKQDGRRRITVGNAFDIHDHIAYH